MVPVPSATMASMVDPATTCSVCVLLARVATIHFTKDEVRPDVMSWAGTLRAISTESKSAVPLFSCDELSRCSSMNEVRRERAFTADSSRSDALERRGENMTEKKKTLKNACNTILTK